MNCPSEKDYQFLLDNWKHIKDTSYGTISDALQSVIQLLNFDKELFKQFYNDWKDKKYKLIKITITNGDDIEETVGLYFDKYKIGAIYDGVYVDWMLDKYNSLEDFIEDAKNNLSNIPATIYKE